MGSELRHITRYPVAYSRPCWMNVISFKKMAWSDSIVKVVNMSPEGVGIEASHSMDPGFVWFPEKIDGHRGGLLMWSKKVDHMYRGGIRFVPLSPTEEQMIQEKFLEEGPSRDPLLIAGMILESLKKSGGGCIVQTHEEQV